MTHRNGHPGSGRAMLAGATALLLASASLAGAQERQLASVDARWAPWTGCWQASARDAAGEVTSPATPLPVVCFAPTSEAGVVDLITVDGAKVQSTQRVDANGTRRAIDREGCKGWETASFSPNGARIYTRSELQCSGDRTRTSTGIMSIAPNGEWLDVQGVKVESHSGVRVAHYGRVPAPAALAADVRTTLDDATLATATARLAVGDSVHIADVVEATQRAEPLVVQTWLAQRGQGFGLDAKGVARLADANVPGSVIDVMVALSYPRAFAMNLAQADGQIIPTGNEQQLADADANRPGPTVFMNWDPLLSSSYGYCSNLYYGCSSAYGYGYGYGYGGYPGSWYRGGPIIVIRGNGSVNTPAATRGRMVRGRGYTRPSDGSSSTPRGRTSGSTRSGDTGSSTAGSSGSSTSGSSGRTAQPRKP